MPIYPAYLGDKVDKTRLSEKVLINKNTPPTFIAITHDDGDRAYYAALLYAALKKNSVIGEIHIYSKGGHGYGLRKTNNPVHTWPDRCRVTGLTQWVILKNQQISSPFRCAQELVSPGVMESSFMTVSPGALIPKRSMPMTWP